MNKYRLISSIACARRLALAGIATTLTLFAPQARAEYGYFHYNGVLGGLGSPDDYLWTEDASDYYFSNAFTLEAWVHPVAQSHRMTILSKGEQTYEFYLTADGKPALVVQGVDVVANVVVPLDAWTHLAVTVEFVGDGLSVIFFKDGALVAIGGLSSGPFPDGHDLTIGASLDDPEAFFEGFIDEARIWNQARSQSEIASSRFVGIGDFPDADQGDAITAATAYQGLLGSWNFNYTNVAYDFIGDHGGIYEGASEPVYWKYPPIPYNLALRLHGGAGDYVVVPDDPGKFNQSIGATLEMWVNPSTFSRSVLYTRGNDYGLSIAADGSVHFRLGTKTISTSSPVLALNRWSHVAVTWTMTAPNTYDLRLFIDGVAQANLAVVTPYPAAGGDVWIGHAPTYSEHPFDGYIDEVRFWHGARSQSDIRRSMFASGRAQATSPLALWGFEGNLGCAVDYDVNGSFNNGLVNGAHFSAYRNESVTGPFDPDFEAHPTVINTATDIGQSNDFPGDFRIAAPFVQIPVMNQVSSQLSLPPTPGATGVEVFLSVRHQDVGNLRCTVKHGTLLYTLFDFNSTQGQHILSFFADAHVDQPDDTIYPAPWGFLAPVTSLAAPSIGVDGVWTLVCTSQGFGGTLQGWGIRALTP